MKKLIGYSTHGHWVSSKEIYEIEEDRGNNVDSILLKEGYEATWICRAKKCCKRYADYDKNEIKTIDLSNAHHVQSMDDGDGGELWIKLI